MDEKNYTVEMILSDIIADSGVLAVRGRTDTDIWSICSDSRRATEHSIFVAVKGELRDGQDFIAQAIAAGADAVVYEDDMALAAQLAKFSPANDVEAKSGKTAADRVTLVKVADSRLAVAAMADNFYGHPSRELKLVGITGTNGKTTTVTLLHQLFAFMGHKSGLLSTIANYVGDSTRETINTTSDPITINSLLREMVDTGCEYCFMEVSSIGLQQQRVARLKFAVAMFSNLTHDHLDYHKTFAEYLRCKKLLFDGLDSDAVAIVNIDDKNGKVMVQNTKAKVVTFACRSMADHSCRIMEESVDGMQLRVDGMETWTKLIGQYNAYNILAIYSAAVELGMEPPQTLIGISRLDSAKGRMEVMRGPKDLTVIIDYAHTPDALDNVLKTLRNTSSGKALTCVFGCGGDRDKAKRPEMAEVAQRYCDRIFVTSDNSRSERTEDIMEDIRQGFSRETLTRTFFISDRKEAIRTAILLASEGSIILLAGKGHETYQTIGSETRHFDEREIVSDVFKSMI